MILVARNSNSCVNGCYVVIGNRLSHPFSIHQCATVFSDDQGVTFHLFNGIYHIINPFGMGDVMLTR
jgi:hypothetical protein